MKNNRGMKKRNLIGAAVMAGLILLAMPMGVAHSLEKLREKATDKFYYDDAGYGISDGLENRREAANNLLTVAGKYTGEHPGLTHYVNELEYQVQASERAYSESYQAEALVNYLLGQAAEELSGQLEGVGLSEKDEKYRVQLMAQMESEQDKIERSSYNTAALKFNDRLYTFPVNFFRLFLDVEELGTFDNYDNYMVGDEAIAFEQGEYFSDGDRAETFVEQADDDMAVLEDRIESYVDQAVEGTLDRVESQVTRKVDSALDRAFETP